MSSNSAQDQYSSLCYNIVMKKRRFLLFIISILITGLIFISASLPWWGVVVPNLKSLPGILPFDASYINNITPVSALLIAAAMLAATGAIFAMKSMTVTATLIAALLAFFWFQSLKTAFDINTIGLGVWAVVAAVTLTLISVIFIRPRRKKKDKK